MKIILSAWLALAATSAFAASDCLEQASNSELLRELELRLGGTTGGNQISRATFTCDSSTTLQIAVIGPNGLEKTAEVYIGATSRCSDVAAQLEQHRSRISTTMVFGVCDSSTYLIRYSVTAGGALNELARRYIGSTSKCEEEQTRLNTSSF